MRNGKFLGRLDLRMRIVLTAILAVILIAAIVLMCLFLPRYKGSPSGEYWKPTDTFDINKHTVKLQKTESEFRILNLADIQMDSPADLAPNSIPYKTIKKLVEDVKPHLITLSGDNAWGPFTKQCVEKLISVIDSFGIPWAPVYGNHDWEGNADLNYLGEMYASAKHCLFRKGPSNIGGVGNYVITIWEGDKVVHALVMMDSGSYWDYSSMDPYLLVFDEGKKVGSGYAFITLSQIEWYKWVIKGIRQYNGGQTVESSAIFHIPLVQYHFAYNDFEGSDFDPAIGVGRKRENEASGMYDSGMFDAILELGSTKNLIVGHDHVNDYSVMYQGVRLTYSVKTGNECYWVDDGTVNGGTILTLDADNNASITQKYVYVGK